jgi:hypothetical protein
MDVVDDLAYLQRRQAAFLRCRACGM